MAKRPIKHRPRRWRKQTPTGDAGRAPSTGVVGPEGGGPNLQRLQKVLAAAGLGSRRESEELITSGRVEVDGKTVTELGTRVDSRAQKITVDGEPLRIERRVYYAVNKPTGVLSTNRDPEGRMRVVDLLGENRRLFTVGRLDQHSEGLIIVTNDGDLTQRLTHPRYGVPKTYLVQVAGEATPELVAKLLKGVHLAEGVARASRAYLRRQGKGSSLLEMTLTEGRNREIRRMLASAGHKVQRLTRTAVGPIRLGKLKSGQYRPLEQSEVNELRELAFGTSGPREEQAREKRPRRTAPAKPRQPPVEAKRGAAGKHRIRPAKPMRHEEKPRRHTAPAKPHPLPFLKTGETSEE